MPNILLFPVCQVTVSIWHFILDQLSGLDEITFRPMMGEYLLYFRGKLFGGIYDNRFLVKPVPAVLQMLPDARLEAPYAGAKEMILVDAVDDSDFLCRLISGMYDELPAARRR
jgi:Regulator of competence-specific genes